MKAFRFRGERALDHRRRQEEDAQHALARAEAAERDRGRQLNELRARAEADGERLVRVQREGAPGWLLDWHRNWMAHTRREVDRGRRELAEAAATVAGATADLQQAHRRRRVLERWRDRAWHRFSCAINLQEMNELNALATQRYLRGAADANDEGAKEALP